MNGTNVVSTLAINNPHAGLTISVSSTVLYVIGILTPYLAFLGLVLGIAASIYTIYSQWKINKSGDKK